MFNLIKGNKDEDNYKLMCDIIKLTLKDESNLIANLSNISAIINLYIDDINWVGFYIVDGEELILGPFQGKPACVRIKVGKGVCGTSVTLKKTMLVDDVHSFKGHIACDSNTNSELVVPIFVGDVVYGVIDLDSPKLSRFSNLEKYYIEEVAKLIGEFLNSINNLK